MTRDQAPAAELNLFDFFSVLWEEKFYILKITGIGILLMAILNIFLPKVYFSEATFFYKSDAPGMDLFGSYSALLANENSQIENQIEEIIKSKSMQDYLVLQTENHFPTFFDPNATKQEKIKALNLKSKLKIFKNRRGFFLLNYTSRTPELSYFIVAETLKQINVFNKTLELSEQSEIIKVLDEPEIPDLPKYPKKVLNLALAAFFCFLLSVTTVIIRGILSKRIRL